MNERDDELREQAWTLISNEERTQGELYETRERWKKCDQKFADLIRADEREACAKVCLVMDEMDSFYGSQFAEAIPGDRRRAYHDRRLLSDFGRLPRR